MKNLSSADKTLAAAAVVFVVALVLHIAYPESIFTEGFLFVAEAALVGGVADWFAVTALFEKPLGFPYHTEILPRRRESFIAASITMVQKEFFSKRNVIAHLEKLHLLPMLMDWLAKKETKERLLNQLQNYIQKFIAQDFKNATASVLGAEIRRHLTAMPVTVPAEKLSAWLKDSGEDRRLINRFGALVGEYAADAKTYELIKDNLEEYARQQAKSPFEQLMAGLAQMLDFVNIDEAAELICRRLKKIAEDISGDSPLTDALTEHLHCHLLAANELNGPNEDGTADITADFAEVAELIKNELVARLPLEKMLVAIFEDLSRMPPQFTAVVSAEYDETLSLISRDEKLRRRLERFLYDLAARSALHAQRLIDVVVRRVLERLTDAELNRLVREKIEPDLQWIRINGSLVGSTVGLIIFCVLTAFSMR